jgi:DHA1 family tetracycline resistance protein-like MFS transporter
VNGTAPPAGEQGELMGSLQSIDNPGGVMMPLVGSAILGAVSHLPPSDPRIGSTFFPSAALQALAVLATLRYFRRAHGEPPG